MLKFVVRNNFVLFLWGYMSIFSKLKSLFNKSIECGDELNGRLIYMYPLKGRVVHINANIIVNEGYSAVFVVNDRVSDVVPSGKHKIGGAVLPVTFSRLKLDRPNKNGNYDKKFKADIYYVCTGVMENVEYSSNEPFYAKSDKFGRIKGFAEGICNLQIYDPENLLKNLLVERPFIPNKGGKQLITDMVGNEVNKMLAKSKVGFSEILLNPKILNTYLNPAINEKTEIFGVRVYNLEVASLKLNRRLQKKVAEFLAERNHYDKQFENTGIKYEPENVVPDKVDVTVSTNQNYNTQNASQPTGMQSGAGPQIVRRGGNVTAPIANTKYEAGNINSSDNILNNDNKKVCKFCGETIDAKFAFCPKCGFKQ